MLKLLLLHQLSAGGEELGLLVSSTAGSTVFFGGGLTELYIDLYVDCLSVCLYPINVKTTELIGPKFCVGSYGTPGKGYE